MSRWRCARSLDVLLDQIDAKYPRRSNRSDGSLGDAAHRARASDHNPVGGVVHARDFTHDPRGGLDCNILATQLAQSKDARIKYIIWNRRKFENGRWRKYTGTNPHDKHLHLSVVGGRAGDVAARWNLPMFGTTPMRPAPTSEPTPKPTPKPKPPEDELIVINKTDARAFIALTETHWRNVNKNREVYIGMAELTGVDIAEWTDAQIKKWIADRDLIPLPPA